VLKALKHSKKKLVVERNGTTIPQILAATLEAQVSGYPVHDRELLDSELLAKGGQ
jgi:hypothetical protein